MSSSDGENGFDLVVVGCGIAGLTAARTVARHGGRVVAIDRLAPGGQLINLGAVHEFPGLPDKTTGPDLAGRLLEEAMDAGVDIRYGEVTDVLVGDSAIVVKSEAETLSGRSVVGATGLGPGRFDIAGAESWAGRGVSECASCDGPLYAGLKVAVVGDDDWAAYEALELAEITSGVVLLAPSTRPGWAPGLAQRLGEAVEVRTGVAVTALEGSDRLSGVRLDDGSELSVSGIFPLTGKLPRGEAFGDDLVRDDHGRLGESRDRGVFVAGDVRQGSVPYLVAAAADGLRAGFDVLHFIANR